MHQLMFITLSGASTSAEARHAARSLLLDDETFCGEGGRFGCPMADWFVIGGRWSGILREAILGQPYKDALAQEYPEFTSGYYTADLVKQNKDGLDLLWQRFDGTASNPLTRSRYDELGADDDAMLIDQFLYDHFLKRYVGTDQFVREEGPDFADLDLDEVDPSFIGRKWLVVVDYHS